MGCCSSKPSDDIIVAAEPNPATNNAASPQTNISTARSDRSLRKALPGSDISVFSSDALPTGTDITQFESSRQASGWEETMRMRVRPAAAGECDATDGHSSAEAYSNAPRPKSEVVDPAPRSISRDRSQPFVGGFKCVSSTVVIGNRSHDELPTANSSLETPGQALIPHPPSAPSGRGRVSTQPDETLESERHSGVKHSAQDGSVPASTDTDPTVPNHSNPQTQPRLEIAELQEGLSSPSGNRSKRLNALDRTGQLAERTKTMFTGGFSDVSQAKLGDRVVAVKVLRPVNIEGDKSRIWNALAREIYVWSTLNHPNVLELLGFATEDGKPCLISPWCDNGTLQEYLQKFPDANRRKLVREIAEGLMYLHEQTPPIIHGDIKTTNVFLNGDHVAKISDFGSSRLFGQLRTGSTTSGSVLATIRYTAPEILRDGQHFTLCSDVFSFASVALETMTDKCPFYKIPNVVLVITEVVFKRQTPSPEDHPDMDDAIWELLRRCWKYEPSHRPKMIDVCKMLAKAGYGSSTSFYPPSRAGPSYPPRRESTL